MCGIAGIFDFSAAAADRSLLERMTSALVHRGPDGVGYLLHDQIGLGHRRLSIIDVEGGAQPVGNEDDTVQVVFNGEIYNFVELRDELQALGHTFRTRSDTEVLVHAYEQWGDDFVNRLNGIFAFALVDLASKRILIARDHLGVKPLYYTTVGTTLLFASEIKALLQHKEVPREVDPEALTELFTYRYVPSPHTLLAGIFKLAPGHLMRVTAQGMSIHRYWSRVPVLRIDCDERELIEQYCELLQDAVRLQLRSDVPLGLFLSSGVDSGALLALMSRESSLPVETFTIDFDGGGRNNEGAEAARIASRYAANHHHLRVSSGDYEQYFERYMCDVEEPVGHESAPAFYFVSKLAQPHVKVALAGQGADEPWAGYGRHVGVKLSQAYSRLPTVMTRSFAAAASSLPFTSERLRRGVQALSERDLLSRLVKVYSFFTEEMKVRLFKDGVMRQTGPFESRRIGRLQQDVAHLDPLSQMLYVDTRMSLPDDLLMVGDKTSMANSIELRVPYLDRRLVEFVESLPPQLKLRGLSGKYLHKKALLKWLPARDVYRRKIGFANPIGQWLRTSMRPLVDDCLLSRDSRIARYFDQGYIRRLVEQDRAGRANFTRHIYLLLSLELWHRTFLQSA